MHSSTSCRSSDFCPFPEDLVSRSSKLMATKGDPSKKLIEFTIMYTADLHLHSSYAYATSKHLNLENMAHWARVKGIDLLASADFTHPEWFDELSQKLTENGDGLYEFDGARFVLGTEVSCIAKVHGRSRRVHLLLFAPSLEVVTRINEAVSSLGKLGSDGRPILGIPPRELTELLLGIDNKCIVIPAHVWTPWYGIFGAKSGFDSLEEAFGDMTKHIHAIETGLSSDPAMNWSIPELDNLSIVSFSDAHSLPKMARELTVFNGTMSYDGLLSALRNQDISHTIEFFPEEGKYHQSGHRRCGVNLTPRQISENGPTCPVCGRLMTLGVLQRVDELASREVETFVDESGLTRSDNTRPPFRSLVGLQQIISEAIGKGVGTKAVSNHYLRLVKALGSEIAVLTESDYSDIESKANDRIAEGVSRVRRGDIYIEPGFDGEYGKVNVWPKY